MLEETINSYLATSTLLTQKVAFGKDVYTRLQSFIKHGKMIRGGLLLLIYELSLKKIPSDVISISASLELFHTLLLIHDDIMDQDRLRRGGKTIFAQYEDYAKSKKLTRPKLIGQNLGICVGDIGFFLAIDLINKTSISQQKKEKILRVISEEYILVILGQMQDVILGAKRKDPSEEEILQVYRLKTARYTFSLPLLLGAMLAKLPLNIQEQLVEIGEDLGILYQIKDDELNIFGRQKIIGKSIGSDISENKKTILRYYLFKQVSKGQRMDIRKFFGKSLSTSDINKIRQLIIKSGTLKKLEDVMRGFEIKVKNKINALQLPQEYKDTLVELLEFVKSRNN